RPPENQIVRINFDAAFSQRHFRSALRLVARNDRGKVLVSKSILENRIASPFAAEACACSQAVRLGIGMGVDEVEIEGDALTIIKKCQSNVEDNSKIAASIREIYTITRIDFPRFDLGIFQDGQTKRPT
ncbi:hypothetical protein Gorai_000404, partial [Gossypium raimondii]|nr:hypothetical protein [Gossypium raimondii]